MIDSISNFEGLINIVQASPILQHLSYLMNRLNRNDFGERFFNVFIHSHDDLDSIENGRGDNDLSNFVKEIKEFKSYKETSR